MYVVILALHSFTRWLVLVSLVYAIYRSYRGWLGSKEYSFFDNGVRHWSATIAHVQLILGLWLYFISPVIDYFLHHYKEAVHEREIRFFGMEHSSMMILGIIVITISSILAKRQTNDKVKFKTLAIGYTLALLIILSSVPWPFSPLVSRPYLRML
jgi:hypothetical protein